MPDIKSVLTEEIRRLAKKEVKIAVAPLAKTISEQRKTISDLKKEIAQLEGAMLQTASPAAAPAEKAGKVKLRLNAARIVAIRKKLKVTQEVFAQLLGVSSHTVSFWELNRVSPRYEMKRSICALRSIGKKELQKRLAALPAQEEEKKAEAPAAIQPEKK